MADRAGCFTLWILVWIEQNASELVYREMGHNSVVLPRTEKRRCYGKMAVRYAMFCFHNDCYRLSTVYGNACQRHLSVCWCDVMCYWHLWRIWLKCKKHISMCVHSFCMNIKDNGQECHEYAGGKELGIRQGRLQTTKSGLLSYSRRSGKGAWVSWLQQSADQKLTLWVCLEKRSDCIC